MTRRELTLPGGLKFTAQPEKAAGPNRAAAPRVPRIARRRYFISHLPAEAERRQDGNPAHVAARRVVEVVLDALGVRVAVDVLHIEVRADRERLPHPFLVEAHVELVEHRE